MIDACITAITSYFVSLSFSKNSSNIFRVVQEDKEAATDVKWKMWLLRKSKHVERSPVVLRCSQWQYTEVVRTDQT